MKNRYLGDRAFYARFFRIAIPIIIQNFITNFVSLLDNIMVGQIGTEPMSGVSIVNQLLFVFNLCIFGASAGAGIFTAQFYGSGDHKSVRHTFRFKLLICLGLTGLGAAVLLLMDIPLIRIFLQGDGDPQVAAATLESGLSYLKIMLWGLLPFAVCNAYSSTLRETGKTLVPMIGGVAAVLVNLGLNYVLIFGHFGAPKMGVEGAALATVISRYVELIIVAGYTHGKARKNPFIQGAYRSFRIPAALLRSIFAKGLPLLANEFLWATGMTIMNQCYSTCGLDVVPAMNISSTIYNLASVAYLSLGNSVGILMGQLLGAGKDEQEIRSANRKLVTISLVSGLAFGVILGALCRVFPGMYNTTPAVRNLAAQLICVSACMMAPHAYVNAVYFTLRSGGQTTVTFLFDSCFVWAVCVPLAYCLSRFTAMAILPLYILCQSTDLVKCALGARMLRRGKWIQNLTQ